MKRIKLSELAAGECFTLVSTARSMPTKYYHMTRKTNGFAAVDVIRQGEIVETQIFALGHRVFPYSNN